MGPARCGSPSRLTTSRASSWVSGARPSNGSHPGNFSGAPHAALRSLLCANRLALPDWQLYCQLVRKPLAAARRSLSGGWLTWLVSNLAIAQTPASTAPAHEPPFSVAVERDDLAVSCPDLPWFTTRIASHAGKAGHAGNFEITLTKRGDAWHARIQRWEQSRSLPAAERVLQDRSPACGPLAEAVALTIAILADDYAKGTEPQAVQDSAADSGDKPPLPSTPATPTAQSKKSGPKVWVGAGGGAAMSWISPIAPVLGFSVALDSVNLRQGLRLMLTPQQNFELDPGRIVVQAWLATVFSCLQLTQAHLGAALCATADVSLLRASAKGFDDAKSSTRIYEAVGLEAQPSWYLSDNVRLSAALAALLPVTRESFSVTGRGTAYVPPELNWRILLFSEIGAF
jgi:hypothetical protein